MKSKWAFVVIVLLLLAPLFPLPWVVKAPLFAASVVWLFVSTKGFARWWTLSCLGFAMLVVLNAEFGTNRWSGWGPVTIWFVSALVVASVTPPIILFVKEYLRIIRAAKTEARSAIDQIRAAR